MNKKTNKQTNKQTNVHLLDPKYLSQIRSDLHVVFREKSLLVSQDDYKKIHEQTNNQTKK